MPMNDEWIKEEVDFIHQLELNQKELEENERQLKNSCYYFKEGKCTASLKGRDCQIFSIFCKKYRKNI